MSHIQYFKESDTFNLNGDLIASTVMSVLSDMKLYNHLNRWVINLSSVKKVDSSAIALLLELIKMAKESNTDIEFSEIPAELMAIAKLSQLDSFFSPKK